MGGLFSGGLGYDEGVRQEGFNRYRQLLSNCFWNWWRANLLTLLGLAPLAVGIFYSIAVSSVLLLLPCSLIGGMIAGPFVACLYDTILRGLRDDFTPWWPSYVRAWRQNWRGSLGLGAVMGLLLGLYSFMGMLFWWAETAPSIGTVLLYLVGLLFLLVANTLLWPQVVLFRQSPAIRLRNCLLFVIRYFWRTMGAGVLQLAYWSIFVLFAPWTLLLLPVIGLWYILFLSQFLLYNQMNESLQIEALYCTEGE